MGAILEDERKLIVNVQNGDLSSFEQLLSLHALDVRAFVAMKLPIPHLIDEIAHETFVFAHCNIADFVMGADFGRWLREIASQLVSKEIRHNKRNNKQQESLLEHYLLKDDHSAFSPEPAVVTYLHECINQLNDEQKGLLERKYQVSESSKEMANSLDKTEAWVRTTLCRMRASLRSCIEKKTNQLN